MHKPITLNIGKAVLALILFCFVPSEGFSSNRGHEQGAASEGVQNTSIHQDLKHSKEFPFLENFESGTFPPDGWALHSLLGDAEPWGIDQANNHTPGGMNSAFHASTTQEGYVDNWMVTPLISVPEEGFFYLSFWGMIKNTWVYGKNSILVSTGSADPADEDYTEVWTPSNTTNGWVWEQFFVNLEEYSGQDIYIAFRYENYTWGHIWNVDDIEFGLEVDDSPVVNISEQEISSALGLNGTGEKTFSITNEGILDLTYEISIDYSGQEGWLSAVPVSGSVGTHAQEDVTLSFDANGLTYGTYEATLSIASNDPLNPEVTVSVSMEILDVNEYPYFQDFEGENFPPIGWSVYSLGFENPNWDLFTYLSHNPEGLNSAIHNYGWDGASDNWLVMPLISFPVEGQFYLSFWSFCEFPEYYGKNSVLVSTGSADPNDGDYVEVWTTETIAASWVQSYVNLEDFSGQDVYIAFRYEGNNAHVWALDDIALGEEVDDSPVLNVSTLEVNQTMGLNGTASKSFKVINGGILDLTFDIEVEYLVSEGWLTVSPTSGSIGTLGSEEITLSLDATGLEEGLYQANLNISGNDPVNPEKTVVVSIDVMEGQTVDFTVIYPQYTFPTAISSDGMYVSGSQFGGQNSYLWTLFGLTVEFPGDALDVSDNGNAVGTYDSGFDYEGMDVRTAGFWKRESQQWQFLGMNPDVPEFFGSDYSAAFGVTHDFETVVGMQWYPSWTVKAFKWTEEGGYQILAPGADYNTRANGISGDGSVIYGWAEPNWTRTPVIWYNDEMIFIDNTQYGESFGASASGNYVTGAIGAGGFLWSPSEGVTLFENTLNQGNISPIAVMEDGTVFGYTSEGFPPTPDQRRAFVRLPNGIMQTFNEYVESRGWFEASNYAFFSINGVTPDGNVFIGAAELPSGEWISFVLNFNPGKPSIEVLPQQISETLELEGTSTHSMTIGNVGSGILSYEALVQYTSSEPKHRYAPQGETYFSGNLKLDSKGVSEQANSPENKTDRALVLHYDADNIDAIGLNAGGTFFAAVRFPTDMVAPFEAYTLNSVKVFINDLPSSLKLLVWNAGTTTTPGQIVHEQLIEPLANSWNDVVLDNPLELSGEDLWIGFEITHDPGNFVMGFDAGATVMDGNWLSEDGVNWEHLSDYGLQGNWNIRAGLDYNGMNWLSMDLPQGMIGEGNNSEVVLSFDATGLEAGNYLANIRITSNDVDNPLVIIPVDLEIEPDDTSVEDPKLSDITIYPNPARNRVHIAGPENMIRFEVINMLGQTVFSKDVNEQRVEFSVAGMENGMYMVRVFTPNGMSVRRLQVTGQQ